MRRYHGCPRNSPKIECGTKDVYSKLRVGDVAKVTECCGLFGFRVIKMSSLPSVRIWHLKKQWKKEKGKLGQHYLCLD